MAIVPLRRETLAEAANVLGRAFQDDPLQQYVLPNTEDRQRLSHLHFQPVLEYGVRFGEVFVTDGTVKGAAVWLPPGSTDVTEDRAAAVGLDRVASKVGQTAADRFFSVLGFLEPFHTTDVPEPHWYTMVVGVDPSAKGQGLGRALLQPVLDKASASGHPCYLETAQPENVSFYQHLGFRVVRDMTEPTSGLHLWTFRWDAA